MAYIRYIVYNFAARGRRIRRFPFHTVFAGIVAGRKLHLGYTWRRIVAPFL